MRHKWSSNPKTRSKNDSSVQCTKCGMIRQYVGGVATYFIGDTVYDRYAPECAPNKKPKPRYPVKNFYGY